MAEDKGVSASADRATHEPNPSVSALRVGIADAVPVCRSCGEPSPHGDPCGTCAEVERILAMPDEELLASLAPEEIGWARGFKEGLGIGLAALRREREQASRSGVPCAGRDTPDMQGVNCFGIPSTYRGWSITQECDDHYYGWGPNYDADYNDEDGFVGNGECVQGCKTWGDLREEIDAYIEDHNQ